MSVTKPEQNDHDTGEYLFEDLPNGSFTIHETPPTGYQQISDITFQVVNKQITGINAPSGVEWDATAATLTVPNQPSENGLTIRKQWLDFDGVPEEPDDIDNIQLTLKRERDEDKKPDDVEHNKRFRSRIMV